VEYFKDLVAPQQLNPGDILFSATRAFQLIFQTDGNLVLYVIDDATLPQDITQGQYTKALWQTATNGHGAVQCIMQADGNLVVYQGNGNAIWNSKTSGNPGAFLRCQDDGNLVLYLGGTALWFSGTFVQARGKSMGGLVPPPPPAPPAQKVWWIPDGSAPGASPSGATVYGSGFAGDACTVVVDGQNFIPTAVFRGSISKGIKVTTPCANLGQTCSVQVSADVEPSVSISVSLQCYSP
jgi:hypothetical protein